MARGRCRRWKGFSGGKPAAGQKADGYSGVCAAGAREPGTGRVLYLPRRVRYSWSHEIVFEDADTIVFLSRYPTLLGYCLVAPRRHAEDWVHDLDDAEFTP